MRQSPCPKAVTHPSTNRARCRATALIETNALPLHQTAYRVTHWWQKEGLCQNCSNGPVKLLPWYLICLIDMPEPLNKGINDVKFGHFKFGFSFLRQSAEAVFLSNRSDSFSGQVLFKAVEPGSVSTPGFL